MKKININSLKKRTGRSFLSRAGLARLALVLLAGFVLVGFFAPGQAFAQDAGDRTIDVCDGAEACNQFIDSYINPLIVLLTMLVGIVAVASIIVGGIQYSSSADDPSKVNQAKQRIFNTVLGLVAYVFLLAFLNYLIPGGIF